MATMATALRDSRSGRPLPVELRDINPDPTRYQRRPAPTFNSQTCETLGIIESWWEPLEAAPDTAQDGADEGRTDARCRHPLVLPRDLHGYRPLRLHFGLPHPANEMNDAWFEVLLSALHELAEDFCVSCFGLVALGREQDGGDMTVDKGVAADDGVVAAAAATAADPDSPWAEPSLSPALLFYASDVARKDDHAGGWDALLADPRQRAYVVQGVLAKLLDEHVFAELLFGGTASQKDALSQWDRIMIKEEGYQRKFKRCEEVQYFLGEQTLTPCFWEDVDRVTAQAAQLLLPLINLQRRRGVFAAVGVDSGSDAGTDAGPDSSPDSGPNLRQLYQRLHDIVALAGYASLCMAWSTSIFRVDFTELGQMWETDQDREGDDHVYNMSLQRARDADRRACMEAAAAAASGDGSALPLQPPQPPPPLRIAKVKIVLWPRITRYKPFWNASGSAVTGATRTILTKTRCAYYSGRARDADDDAEALPDLHAHVAAACAARTARARARHWAHRQRTTLWLLLLMLLASTLAYGTGGIGCVGGVSGVDLRGHIGHCVTVGGRLSRWWAVLVAGVRSEADEAWRRLPTWPAA